MRLFFYRIEKSLAMTFFGLTCIFVLLGAAARTVGHPLIWSVDLAQLMFAWTCAFAVDLTLKHRGHVVINILSQTFPLMIQKALNIFWQIVMIAFLVVLIVLGYRLTILDPNRVMGDTGLSYAFVNASIPVAAFLMLMTTLEQLWANLTNKDLSYGDQGEEAPL